LFAAVLALAVLAAPSAGWSQPTCNPHNPAPFVRMLIERWAVALAGSTTSKPDPVVDKYAPNENNEPRAILLPTCSPDAAKGTTQIKDYFAGTPGHPGFLSYEPKMTPNGEPTAGGDCSTVLFGSGLYTFELKVNGQVKTVRARYTYIFEPFQTPGPPAQWLIVQHHSSLVPKVQDNTCP